MKFMKRIIPLFLVIGLSTAVAQEEPVEVLPVEVPDVTGEVTMTLNLADIENMLFSSPVLRQRARFYHQLAAKADGNGNVPVNASEQAVLQRRYPGLAPVERRLNDKAAEMRDRIYLDGLVKQMESLRTQRDNLKASFDAAVAERDAKQARRLEVVAAIQNYQENTPTEPAAIQEFEDLKAERLVLIDEIQALNDTIISTRDALVSANEDLLALRDRIQSIRNP